VRGAKASPGEYVAKIKSGADSAEATFVILADPNYTTTTAEYDEQVRFLLAAKEKFSDVMKGLKNIKELRQQLTDLSSRAGKEMPKEVKQQIDTIGKQITVVEEALHQTKAKSGQDVLNYPIRLDDKLASVYNVVAAGNAAPSAQAKLAYAELASQIDVQLNTLAKILKEDIARLNQLIHEKMIPVIGVK
jgi:hypothetical protein